MIKPANQIAAAIAQGALPTEVSQHKSVPPVLDSAAINVVNLLFVELQSIFPAWRQAWPTDAAIAAAKKTWIKAFAAAGITRVEQIRSGIERCRLLPSDFIPSVGRFIEFCAPTAESLGLPTEERAYREAVRNAHPCMAGKANWSHDAVFHAARETGYHTINNSPEADSRKLFAYNYALAVRDLIDGKPLSKKPLALPETVAGQRTPEVGNAALAELRGVVN
jgi:hypothetical protein